ncbi:LysR family transcriptional regulator [Enterococcus sp. AZ103]|uniref:LysR family transcriptional regulator n=1 Tax=Enterococcus sp. AZ103 TaxID=2774628 RepID=UPI003F25A7A8
MNLQHCRYVIQIAKAGSFSQAAKDLFVTQPSLSSAVKDLEGELGISLFTRSKSGVLLTEEGSDFLVYAHRILAQVSMLENHYQGEKQKSFIVASQHYDFLSQPFLKVTNKFQQEIQSFQLIETTTKRILESLRDFESEVGIIYLDQKNQQTLTRYFKQEKLSYEVLGEFKTQIFLRRDHPLSTKKTIQSNDLKEFPQVRFIQEEQGFSHFDEDPLEINKNQINLYTNDRGTLMNLLAESDAYASGLGIVAGFIKKEIILKPFGDSLTHQLIAVTNSQRKKSSAAIEFISEIKEILSIDLSYR